MLLVYCFNRIDDIALFENLAISRVKYTSHELFSTIIIIVIVVRKKDL